MEGLYIILLGLVAAGVAVFRGRWRQRVTPKDAASAASAGDAEPLAARLHRLEGTYSEGASNLAHPRELEDRAAFR